MIKESRFCSDVMKKHFDKELLMTKEDNEDFKQSTKCYNDSLTMIMLIMMLKKEINVISLENIEPLHIETVIS